MTRTTCVCFAMLACSATPVLAADPFAVDSPWMTGDWGGLRSAWLQQGIDIKPGYTGETATLLHGGYARGEHPTRYSDQFSVGADIDLEKLLGWQDAQFSVTVSNRNGQTLDEQINDPRATGFGSVQEIHGRGNVTRLSGLWVSKGWLDDAVNLKLGRMAASDDFASEDCVFQNVAFCGSQPGNYMSSIYNGPISQWGVRLRGQLTDELFVQIGAYDINPRNLDNDNGFKLNRAGRAGSLLPLELIWRPTVGGLPGEYRLGYLRTTAQAPDVYADDNGQAAAASGNAYRSHSGRHGWWLVGKQQLTQVGADTSRGLSLVASATFHDRATTPVHSYQKVSLIYTGLFDARPADALGFGVARIQGSSRFLRNASTGNAASGVTEDSAGYLPEQHSQYQAEVHYRIQATGWLSLMPNLQYIKDPAGVREVDDAWVLGLQVQTQF